MKHVMTIPEIIAYYLLTKLTTVGYNLVTAILQKTQKPGNNMKHVLELTMTIPEIEALQSAIRVQVLKATAAFKAEGVAIGQQSAAWEQHLAVTAAFKTAEEAKKTYSRELDSLFELLDKWFDKGLYDGQPVCIDGVEYSRESWQTWTATGRNE